MAAKRFMLFAGSAYYPSGGWEDFRGYFNSIAMAKEWVVNYDFDMHAWAQIVLDDTIILYGNGEYHYVEHEGEIIYEFRWEWRSED